MKISTFFLFLALLQVSAKSVFSQDAKVTLSEREAKVADILNAIEKQTSYLFFYSPKEVDLNRSVVLSSSSVKVSDVLKEIFEGTDINYKMLNQHIVLTRSREDGNILGALSQDGMLQKKLTGTVTDATTGEPIIGANVIVDGTTIGAITDAGGNFSLDVPNSGTSIVVSYLGYNKETVIIGGQSVLNIKLVPDVTKLDEVVVVGYGTQKKSDIISSVTSVKADEMTKTVTLDVGEMLRGKAAGVQITTSDAGPGASSNIQIRGKGSLAAGTAPIVIVDGVQVGAINDVNPGDISSVEILKDAAAQAIYGARASNGVILITTKRGKAGQATVSYSGYYGVQTVKRKFDIFSPLEFAQLKREAYRTNNAGGAYGADNVVFGASELKSLTDGTFIDWEKEVLRTGSIQNHDLSFSAGTENTKIYVGTNFQNNQGVVPFTDFNKGMIRFNLDQKINKWLKLGLNTSLSLTKSNDIGVGGILIETIRTSPLGQVYNDDGTLKVHPTGFQENWNPLNDLNETSLVKNGANNLVNMFLDITPVVGLNYRINLSRRAWNYKQENYSTLHSNAGTANGVGNGSITRQENAAWTIENILSYEKSIGTNNHLSGTFVHSYNEQNDYYFNLGFPQMPSDILGIYGLESSLSWTPNINGSKRALNSFAARVQYDFASKYYITLSGRRDGSSVFGADNKWGFFPAVAFGWNIHKEGFMTNFKSLNNLKLRASYGSVGNEAISPYGSSVSADSWDYYSTTKVLGYAPGSALPNPKLKWETSTTLNTALDFGFFQNRLTGTIELYKTNTTDLLVNRSLNAATGYTSMRDNIGEVENKGIELQLDGTIIRNRDLTVSLGILFSKNNNQILKLFGDANGDGIEDDYIANRWFIGHPIDVSYDYQQIGIWQENEVANIPSSAQPTAKPGYIKIQDNGDKILNNDDRVIKSRMPGWLGSVNLNASYKGFDFSMDVSTVQDILKYNKFLAEYAFGGDLRGIFNGVKVDYWTPENPTGTFPRPTNASTPSFMNLMGDQDASYIKLQNISLGYTLPTSITSKLHIGKLRIYCTGQNLYTKTDYMSYSPELDPDAYPEARTIIGGIQIGF